MKMTIAEMREIIDAHAAGKQIQFTSYLENPIAWYCITDPCPIQFNFSSYRYRIKPVAPREWWLIEDKTRDLVLDVWKQAPTIYDVTTFQRVIRVREVIE